MIKLRDIIPDDIWDDISNKHPDMYTLSIVKLAYELMLTIYPLAEYESMDDVVMSVVDIIAAVDDGFISRSVIKPCDIAV